MLFRSFASVSTNGTVTIVAPGSVTLTASQGGDTNYTAASNVTQSLTVSPKNLTVTGLTANNKTYDGNTTATLSGTGSLVGVVGSDDVSLTGTPTGTFDNPNVGTGKTVTVAGYLLNGTTVTYYTLTQPSLLADIIATTPTVFTSGTLSALTTVYGTASSSSSFNVSAQSLTEGVLITAPTGFEVSSDNSTFAGSVTVGTTGNLASTPIYVRLKATNAVGTYFGDITLTSSGATSITVATVSSTVTQKPLTITGLTGVDKTYNGSAAATVTGTASLVGIVGSDDVTLSGTPSFSFADANASASTKPITALGYTLNGTAVGNYSVSQPTGLTAFINKANQTIAAISVSETRTFGDATYSVANTSDSGLTVTYSSSASGIATVSTNGTVTIVGAGSTTITAAQAGNTNYNTATSLTQNLTVNKASQTLTALTSPVNKVFGDAPYSATSTASSALTVSYSSDTPAVATVASNGTVTIVGVGSAIISASQSGNTNYDAATSVTQQLNVAKASQTITFNALANKTTADTAFNLTATASSGLTVSYTSSNPAVAAISGSVVTIGGVGTTTITANQAGNTNYNAALQVTQTLTVTQPACASVSGTTSYNFGTVSPFTASPTTTQSNVTLSALSQGNSFGASTFLSLTSASSGYTGASGTGNAGIAAVNGAFSTTTSAYFSFTVTPAAGYNFTLSGISFGSRSTSSGPQAYTLRSSLDSYANDISTGSMLANSAYALKSNTGLSVTGNGNANPVTFRIYGFNA